MAIAQAAHRNTSTRIAAPFTATKVCQHALEVCWRSKAVRARAPRYVRVGPKAGVNNLHFEVCFTFESGHQNAPTSCRPWTNRVVLAPQQFWQRGCCEHSATGAQGSIRRAWPGKRNHCLSELAASVEVPREDVAQSRVTTGEINVIYFNKYRWDCVLPKQYNNRGGQHHPPQFDSVPQRRVYRLRCNENNSNIAYYRLDGLGTRRSSWIACCRHGPEQDPTFRAICRRRNILSRSDA